MTPLLALALAVTTAGPVLTLDEALAEAQHKNLDLKAARARLQQAEQASRKAWAGYLPTVNVGGTYTRNSDEARILFPLRSVVRDTGAPTSGPPDETGSPTNLAVVNAEALDITLQPLNQFGAQAEVRQALIVPQLWAGIQAATQAEHLAELNIEAQRREILFAVAQAYYGASASEAALRAQTRLLELNQAREKDTQARFQAGTVTRVAVLRAQLDRTRAEQDLLRSRNALSAAKLALATLLQRDPNFELAPPAEPQLPAQQGDLAEKALEQRPDVAASRENEELARTNRRGAWLSYLPTVGLSGAYRWSNAAGFTGKNTSWLVTLAASWTLWDGGLREANLHEQSAKVAEAEALRQSAEARTREEVARYQLELESALANRSKAQEAVELARESARLTDISFRAGVATYLEVADANTSLTSAEVGFVAEQLQASLAALRLLKSAGVFPPPNLDREGGTAQGEGTPPATPAP
ncbi:TolC family protein [Hyalangium versicolor]|uniref:TolC family protein n=1 Tax=Hyalangium versicolor TaxID=2861190 RepID=UPI001CCDAD46|nr:TolC family protein [Hyalangium versicolor]